MKFRYLLWSLAGLLLIVVLTLSFLLFTQTGLHTLFAIAEKVMPGTLTYEHIAGRLSGPLRVEGLHYRDGELDVKLKQAEFDWFPRELLLGRLHIGLLQTDGLRLHLPTAAPTKEEPPDKEPFDFNTLFLPLQLEITELAVLDTHIWPAGADQPVIINAITLQAATQDRTVQLESLEFKAPQGSLNAAGHLELSGNNPLVFHVQGTIKPPEADPLTLQGNVSGHLRAALALNLRISGAATAELVGNVSQVLQDPHWIGKLDLSIAELGKVAPALAGNELSGHLETKGNLQAFQVGGQLTATLPEVGPINTDFALSGNPQSIKLNELTLSIADSPLLLATQGEVNLAMQTAQASGHWQSLAWPLNGPPQVESAAGEFTLQGSRQNYNLNLKASLSAPDAEPLNAYIEATGTEQALELSKLSLRSSQGELALDVRGKFNFADSAFQANGEWQSLAWPLSGIPQVQSPKGSFTTSGRIKDYRFELNTRVQGPDIPQGDWHLQGRGSDQNLRDFTLTGKLLDGEIRGSLNATWQPFVSWQAKLTGSELNPGVHWPDMQGKLALTLLTQGSLQKNTLQAEVNLEELSGDLRGQAVQGQAQMTLDNQNLAIRTLALTAGNSRLKVAGNLTENWNIDWQLSSPDLSQLLPTATGKVSSSGNIQGPREQPRADLALTITSLSFGETAIQRFAGNAAIDISGATRSNLSFSGDSLRLAGQTWQTFTLQGSGTPGQHVLESQLVGELGNFSLALDGSFDKDEATWRGQLNRLTARGTTLGDWRLQKPMSIAASAQQATAESGCLVSSPTQLCLQGSWNANTGASGQLNLQRLDIKRFAFLLPENVTLSEFSLSGKATGSSRPEGRFQGNVSLRLSPGSLTLNTNGAPAKIAINGGTFQAKADNTNATAELDLALGVLGQIKADVQIKDPLGQPRLAGTLNANLDNLQPISAFVPQVQNVSGQILANLDLSGTLTAPAIGGELRLNNAAVEIPETATHIEDIQLAAVSSGEGILQLSGSARSGAGELQLSGQLQPAAGEVEITVTGKEFQVADSPELHALISPDIDLRMAKNRLQIEGQVVIPEAYLSPAGGGASANRISASSDVVIVDETKDTPPAPAESRLAVFTKVRVILEEVTVEAFDFRGKLKGNLMVEQTPQLAPRGTGSIEVESGEYIIYSQPLTIERGRVLFSGSPLDNPGLDLRVTRTVDNVTPTGGTAPAQQEESQLGRTAEEFSTTALNEGSITVGAQVTGTLQNPQLTLFSNPAMPDSSILSYLVLGRPPNMEGQTSLSIGKYLTPDLYVGYGLGLFDAVNTFLLRYRLGKRLHLEASSSGETTGADILYTIELR